MDLEFILSEAGHAVLGPAPSVDRALAILEREAPDGALLDLNLAGVSSAPVAERLRERGVPFVVVSSYGRTHAASEGVRDEPLVTKPYDPANLLRVLGEALAAARVPDRGPA